MIAAAVSILCVLRMRPRGRVPFVAFHEGHHANAGLETREPERQLRERQQGYAQYREGIVVVGEQLGLPISDVGGMRHAFVEPHGNDDEVQQQVGSYHEHRDADGFLETLEKDRAERSQQHEGNEDVLASEELRHQGVLHYVRRGVRRGERDRDQPGGRHETEEDQHEDLPLPEREVVFENRDRPLPVRALLGDAPVHRQGPEEGQEHDQQRGYGRENTRRKHSDARYVA